MHVLHVDDDQEDGFLVSSMLSNHGIDVTWTGGFNDAVELVDREAFDAMLVDIRLNGRSGLDLIEEARRRGYEGPCVVLTGFADNSVDAKALEMGAAAFLQKDELTGPLLARAIRYATARREKKGEAIKSRRGDLPLQMALARGLSIRQAAEVAGVSERTIHRRLASASFRAEVEKVWAKLLDTMIERVAGELTD